ncbi:MAG: polyprenyl synthetase family protein [Longimicrobiales bacterium]
MGEASFTEYLGAHRDQIESGLVRAVDALEASVPGIPMAPVRHGVFGSGKRLRPVLLVAAYESVGGMLSDATYDLAASVELIHAYSLMHDDLPCMDDAPLRRGKPTPHTLHGTTPTMLAAAALIPWGAAWALQSMERLGCTRPRGALVTQILLEAAGAGGMVGGQALDLLGEGQALGEEALSALHRLKTGALLAASLKMGAVAAEAPDPVCMALQSFGEDVGLAFQVMDDLLDATATAEALGKQPSDADLGKSTYVLLLGVEGARARAETLVARAVATLDAAALEAPRLRQLSRFVVERGH